MRLEFALTHGREPSCSISECPRRTVFNLRTVVIMCFPVLLFDCFLQTPGLLSGWDTDCAVFLIYLETRLVVAVFTIDINKPSYILTLLLKKTRRFS